MKRVSREALIFVDSKAVATRYVEALKKHSFQQAWKDRGVDVFVSPYHGDCANMHSELSGCLGKENASRQGSDIKIKHNYTSGQDKSYEGFSKLLLEMAHEKTYDRRAAKFRQNRATQQGP